MKSEILEQRLVCSSTSGADWSASLTSTESVYLTTDDQNQTIKVERGSAVEIGRHLYDNLVNDRVEFTVLAQDEGRVATVAPRQNQNIRGVLRNRVGDTRILLVSIAGTANILVPDGEYNRISIDAGGGRDLIRVAKDVTFNVTLNGGTGNDTIQGGTRHSEIHGGAGNDWIASTGGTTILDGGRGDDIIYAGPGDDTIFGGSDEDKLFRNGEDTIDGIELYF